MVKNRVLDMLFYHLIVLILLGNSNAIPQYDDEDIIGGKNTNISQIPYQATLIRNGITKPICGGAIIGDREIVTAAHCVKGKSAQDFQIQVGTSILSKGGSVHQVSKILIHDQFSFPHNDIAIVQIQDHLKFSEYIQPIEIAGSEPIPGSLAVVSGWGYLSDSDLSTDVLQSVALIIIDRTKCGDIYETVITQDIICAGNPQTKGNSCNGDSGGPLVVNHQLVGLVSFRNIQGCEVDYTSGYCSMSFMKDWLLRNMNDLRQTKSSIQNLTANSS